MENLRVCVNVNYKWKEQFYNISSTKIYNFIFVVVFIKYGRYVFNYFFTFFAFLLIKKFIEQHGKWDIKIFGVHENWEEKDKRKPSSPV